jgi:spectrin beta
MGDETLTLYVLALFLYDKLTHPYVYLRCSDQIGLRQSQVDKLYASLKDLSQDRRGRLDEVLKLYMMNREIEDLLQWIAEREVVAGSHELGQDYEHVTVS